MADNDGVLMVQLAQWQATAGIEDAIATVFSSDFDPETADAQDQAVRKALMWGETLGTMTKNGLISQELVLDWMWMSGLWKQIGKAALAAREEYGEPKLYENFEALAKAQG